MENCRTMTASLGRQELFSTIKILLESRRIQMREKDTDERESHFNICGNTIAPYGRNK